VSFVVSFANGGCLRGELLEDARRCLDVVRQTEMAASMLPAQVWGAPAPLSTATGFAIPNWRLVEEHLRRGVLAVPTPPATDRATRAGDRELPQRVLLESCGADEPWLVEGRLEEWATVAGRDGFAWAGLAQPIPLRITTEGPSELTHRVLVGARHPGWDLRNADLPVHVYVCRPTNGADHGHEFAPGDILTASWATADRR
jgi:hypothetical protein